MSDPMTNTEVEDVLSSIRRLVSDGKRKSPDETSSDAASDRLVLTPSLRINDAPENDAIDAEATDAGDAAGPTPWPEHTAPSEPVAEEQPDPETSFIDTTHGDSDDPLVGEDDAPEPDVPDAFDRATGEREHVAEAAEAECAERVESESDAEDLSLSQKIAALETLISGQTQDWEPDGVTPDGNAGTDAPAMEWEDVGPKLPEPEVDLTEVLAEVEETPVAVEEEPQLVSIDATLESETEQVNVSTAGPDVSETEPPFFVNDEDVLDEDALRDLVSNIVREELQGALGERITRNVRKLVRREIQRALAAQDFD